MQHFFKTGKLLLLTTLISFLSCSDDDTNSPQYAAEPGEELLGGETTIFDESLDAFSKPAPNLASHLDADFFVGNSLFKQNWVTAPASTTARDGLGPLFNAKACSTCHFKDGRGRAPLANGEINHGLLIRLSIPGVDAHGGPLAEPNYGGQLQDQSIHHLETEGAFEISYTDKVVTYPDGKSVTLRKPTYALTNLTQGEISDNVMLSPRVGNQIIGLGLLEAIPEADVLANVDLTDADGDGVSGKANQVWDVESQSLKLGRFGWKSNQPSLLQQVAGAYNGDMGITSYLFPDENCPPNVECDDIPNGGSPEITDENLISTVIYSSTLAVPARRNWEDQDVLAGKELFKTANCTACHTAKFETGNHSIAALSNQTIRPYTDLLLHDMGDDLADNRPDFDATGNEWRTQPLWGIGLIETVNGHTNLLHDGRARNIEEAILWHGGEAENSKQEFMNFTEEEREQVLKFINSL
ncbi:di-heme oxidoredictase family protein [Aureivirga sp. CE67]|uniref:di-heme oxidoreductase family protein n=1 Tax=Aureivirga sp. CE67 TaxID=1788983 RepID=UPI0018CB92B8|nr:di-heme oxidoredictase family protein [Aureivirga sp. CE67]